MTDRFIPCPSCSIDYSGKKLPSYRRPSCRVCRGTGFIRQVLEAPKVIHVLSTLDFGNMAGGDDYPGVTVCVNERPWCCSHEGCHHAPLLDDVDFELLARIMDIPHFMRVAGDDGHETSTERLEVVGRIYDAAWGRGNSTFVHCSGGRERSVLATAYLMVTRHGWTWEGAYRHLFTLDPGIFDRRQWLDWDERKRLEER